MTRINSAINPFNLTDQHLISELRELPRIFTAVNNRIEKGQGFDDIPEEFTLGTGHCKFFYDKLKFLSRRHIRLREEYNNRYNKIWENKVELGITSQLFDELFCEYAVTVKEWELLIERISTRITESNQIPRYYGKPITKQQAIEILKR